MTSIANRDRDLGLVLGKIDRITDAVDPWVGRVLSDRYRITRHIADGGMGRVYEGVQLSLGVPVAIKILGADHDTDRAMTGLSLIHI